MDPEESVALRWVRQALLDLLSGKPVAPLAEHGHSLDGELQELCETTNHLIEQFSEAHDFLSSLSRGILDIDPPPKNLLISPFKTLHSNLRHLTWQTKQVATGDLNQYVDFLGEFSDAFNSMIASLREKREAEEERERLVVELQQALAKVRKLNGLLPLCSSCKRIRNDQGYWQQIEAYIRDHSEADFSHSICPQCAARLYPELGLSGEE